MGEKGVGKLSRETPPPREGEPMGAESSERTGTCCAVFTFTKRTIRGLVIRTQWLYRSRTHPSIGSPATSSAAAKAKTLS